MDTGGHSGSPAEPKVRKRDGKRWIPTLSAPHRIFTRRRSLVRVQQSPPKSSRFRRRPGTFLFMGLYNCVLHLLFLRDPNRDPKAERSGKHRRGADGIIRPSPAVFCGLHGLTDATADGIGGTRGLTQAAHRVRLWKAASPSPCRAPAHLSSETADNSSCCRTGGRVYTFITMNTYRLLQKWPPTEVRFGTPHR